MRSYQLGKLAVVGGVLIVALVAALFAVWPALPDLPPVGPVDPVCEQVVAARAADLVFEGIEEEAATVPKVPFGELPRYRSDVVQVVGFLFLIGDYDAYIAPSRDAVVGNPTWLQIAKVQWQDFRPLDYWWSNRANVSCRCARVTAKYSWSRWHPEHIPRLYTLRLLEVWSEPHRPVSQQKLWSLFAPAPPSQYPSRRPEQ
jgi:hypothetical protein